MSDTRASRHVKLQGVADTTYIPMVARIYATERFPEYFRDATALKLRDRIPVETLERIRKHSSEYTMLASVARYHVLDELVRSFAARYPGGCNVINLGAGLETMAQRLSLPAVTFYEIDLPKTIELRRSLIDPLPSEVIIAGDMFELGWTGRVDRKVPSLLIASGVFQYFREERVTEFLRDLAERLPGSELVFDATNEVGVRYANRYVKRTGNASAQILFYVNDARAFADELGMPLVEERGVLKGELRLWTRIAMRVCDDKRRAILVHLKLQDRSPAQLSGAASRACGQSAPLREGLGGCGQTAPLREVKLQTDLCGPWRNPPRRLAGGCSSAFAQLSHFP